MLAAQAVLSHRKCLELRRFARIRRFQRGRLVFEGLDSAFPLLSVCEFSAVLIAVQALHRGLEIVVELFVVVSSHPLRFDGVLYFEMKVVMNSRLIRVLDSLEATQSYRESLEE